MRHLKKRKNLLLVAKNHKKNNYSSDISTLITIKADISKENKSSLVAVSTPNICVGLFTDNCYMTGEFTSGLKQGD